MRKTLWVALAGSALLANGTSSAQVVPGVAAVPPGVGAATHVTGAAVAAPAPSVSRAYAAPGLYGVAYGYPSFGVPLTYSAFSSSYGPGYAYGYAPPALLPGPYGAGLWRPGFVAPGNVYGEGLYYRTFPVPYRPGDPGPPIGLYAPGYGPPSDVGR